MDSWETLENTNSNKMSEHCENNNLVVCNAFFIPKNRQTSNLATWYSPNGEIEKQLDYNTISKRYRNWVKRISNDAIANIASPMQHRALIMDIKIKLKSTYFETANGAFCPYDIHKARTNPEKVKGQIDKLTTGDIPLNERWEYMQSSIRKIPNGNYPISKMKLPSKNLTHVQMLTQANYELFAILKKPDKNN